MGWNRRQFKKGEKNKSHHPKIVKEPIKFPIPAVLSQKERKAG